jgi:hypothetical protein
VADRVAILSPPRSATNRERELVLLVLGGTTDSSPSTWTTIPPARIGYRDMVIADLASFEADLRDRVGALLELVAVRRCVMSSPPSAFSTATPSSLEMTRLIGHERSWIVVPCARCVAGRKPVRIQRTEPSEAANVT